MKRTPLFSAALRVVLLSSLLTFGCVTIYRPIALEKLEMSDGTFNFPESNVQVSIKYKVLENAYSRLYARVAKDNNLSFIALKIKNNSEKPINPATDLVYRTNDGDEITPLTCQEALSIIVEPVTESTGVDPNVDVDANIWHFGIFVNQVKKATSHYKFVKDITQKYINDQTVAPNTELTGFIALPVKESTPITLYWLARKN